jgi:hypothetical protein
VTQPFQKVEKGWKRLEKVGKGWKRLKGRKRLKKVEKVARARKDKILSSIYAL